MNAIGRIRGSLRTALLLVGLAAVSDAFAALVRIVEPFSSTDDAVMATTSTAPAFEWASAGAINRFELQLSDRADFASYWFRSADGTTRRASYSASDWSGFNTAAVAPDRLADGVGYFVRITAFAADGSVLAQSATVPFKARALASGTYCNPDFDPVTPNNANPHRTRGLHVLADRSDIPSIRFQVTPSASGIQSHAFDGTGNPLCTLNGGPLLRSREGIPSKGLNATMTMRFDLRTQGYFDRIAMAGPHISAILLSDMASQPSTSGGPAASEGIGAIFGNLSNWTPAGNCVRPALASGDPSGNLSVIESARNSEVCIFGNDSINYDKLTDQTYHVEIRITPVLRGVGVTRNRISYRLTSSTGALVAQAQNFVDDKPPTTRMHGGWLLFAVIGGQSSLPPFDLWFENIRIDYSSAVTADGLPVGNDLLAAYDSPDGLRLNKNGGSWTTVFGRSPRQMANGDLDADGVSDVLMDFGTAGLWMWRNGASWQAIQALSAEALVATDLDANGKTDFIVNFGSPYGLHIYSDSRAWRKLHSIPPRQIVSASLDGDPRRDLVVDFGPPHGIWLYLNNSEWVSLHGFSATDMVAGDLDGNDIDDILVDFGDPYGIWVHMNRANWMALHGTPSRHMATGNFDSDRRKDLVVDFGVQHGIWIWMNNTTWIPVHGTTSESLAVADLDRNDANDLVIDFGPAFGVWAWMNGQAWARQSATSPQALIAIDADRN